MININAIALILYIPAILAIVFGVNFQREFDMSDGVNLLISLGSIFCGLFLIGIAEIIRLLSKISKQIMENN